MKRLRRTFGNILTSKLEADEKLSPTFNLSSCIDYFKNIWKCVYPGLTFTIPAWIPNLLAPKYEFQATPPTYLYAQITCIIRKIKSKSSACPLDQLSIIPFKKSAYLRSYLTAIISEVWISGRIPNAWKRAITILIHKKDSTDDPSNFRPITLQSVPLKIFTSALRNRMYEFLLKNEYIENSVQKGFTPGMTGTSEHTAHLAHLIRQAKKQQRSLIVTRLKKRVRPGPSQVNLNHVTLS